MKDIYSYIQEPFTISTTILPNNQNLTLHVPAGTKALYLATSGWNKVGEDHIVEMGSEPTVKPGDVNNDGTVSVADAVAIISYVLGENPSNFNAAAADVNGDGKVTVTDAVEIIKICVEETNPAN